MKINVRNCLIATVILLNNAVFSLNAQREINTNKAFSLFLIGDAGDDTKQNDVHKTLQKHLEKNQQAGVLFLGDNIYPRGLDGSKDAELKLLTQLSMLKNFKGDWYFIPGNHDWAKGRWRGYKNILRQAKYINKYAKDSLMEETGQTHFLPEGGLPGPITREFGNTVLIFSDTDWWLHRQFFHKVGRDDTYKKMGVAYFKRLDSILTNIEKQQKIAIFLSHHPIVNYGEHGVNPNKKLYYSLVNYTPLQLFGLVGVNRALNSEMTQPRYARLANSIYTILAKHKNVIAIAGHEHNLQAIKRDNHLFLISGSGSKLTPLKKKITQKDCLFAATKPGFAELIFNPSGIVNLKMWSDKDEILYQTDNVLNLIK